MTQASQVATVEFTEDGKRKVEWLLGRYPTRKAALLPVLRIAEEEFGSITDEAIPYVAGLLGLSPGQVYGVVTFYTHFRRPTDGKYLIQVCGTLSCALRGCASLTRHLEEKLGIKPGETTKDKKFTVKKVECLASCDTAPVIELNGVYHENLTVEKLDGILDGLP